MNKSVDSFPLSAFNRGVQKCHFRNLILNLYEYGLRDVYLILIITENYFDWVGETLVNIHKEDKRHRQLFIYNGAEV